MKRLSWFVFFSIIAISCLDQPDCYQLNNNLIGFGFKIIGGGTDTYNLKSVSVAGPGLMIADTVGSGNLILPLDPYSHEIEITFEGLFGPHTEAEKGKIQTRYLKVNYNSLVQFVSEDCGERHVFSDLEVDSTDYDQIRMLNTRPTNSGGVNFDIYRCARTDLILVDLISDDKVASINYPAGGVITLDGTSLGSVLLPVDLTAKTSTYLFNYVDGGKDSLTVIYRKTEKILSDSCGLQIFVDSMHIVDAKTNFSKFTMKEDSVYDLPNKVNIEVTR